MEIYGELAPRWYRLIDPLEDHQAEAACYEAALLRAASIPADTLLELGAGAGNNAFYLKRRFRCTLTDRSPQMMALSRESNPDCEHVSGDMRSLRLGRLFDVVLVHDAVMYATTEGDLRATVETAFIHTRPGGAALFVPDCLKDTFRERTELMTGDNDERSLRGVSWMWDPNPGDDTFINDYILLLRENSTAIAHHDRHVEGIFSREAWLDLLSGAGYVAEATICVDDEDRIDAFLCRRPV